MISDNALQQLEYNRLLRIIAGFSHSPASQQEAAGLRPFSSRSDIEERQARIAEIMRLQSEGGALHLSSFPDISNLLSRVRPEGSVLDGIELAGLKPLLQVISDISAQLAGIETMPALRQLAEGMGGFDDMLKLLNKSLDSEGNILDTASHTLATLRAEIRRLEARIRKRLEDMTRDEGLSVFLQDDFVTTRSGRWVIPVRMDSKGLVDGVVHDVSKSGETAFVEPVAIISLSNELENLNAEQKAEEIRILRVISARVRERMEEIQAQFRTLVHIDLLNSMALFGSKMRMHMPEINEAGSIELNDARHPLLLLAFEKHGSGRSVVPLTVRLGGENRVMVVTGANAGGKTITIKTIGLLVLMALTGMPLPANPSSSVPVVSDVLIDIGDDQSIDDDQSTFSAHISHISDILKRADNRALILLDELGTGTDPAEGAAIACAVLNEIRSRGALLFATTHLMDIKGYVHRTEGMLNASMEFDQKTLTPLYRLRVGEPGQSHAIEIARRYGLPEGIITSARQLLGGVKEEFDNLIHDLSEKRARYEEGIKQLEAKEAELNQRELDMSGAMDKIRQERDAVMADAYRSAAETVAAIKREMHELLEASRRADREQLKASIKSAEARAKELSKTLAEYLPEEEAQLTIEQVSSGDTVYVRSINSDAVVVSVDLKHDRIRVNRGGIELEVPFEGIARSSAKKGQKPAAAAKSSVTVQNGAEELPESTINVIGRRVDDALEQIEPLLNHAALAGMQRISVIHGVGTGALMKAIRGYLRSHPLVESFRAEEQNRGGSGVTLVFLK